MDASGRTSSSSVLRVWPIYGFTNHRSGVDYRRNERFLRDVFEAAAGNTPFFIFGDFKIARGESPTVEVAIMTGAWVDFEGAVSGGSSHTFVRGASSSRIDFVLGNAAAALLVKGAYLMSDFTVITDPEAIHELMLTEWLPVCRRYEHGDVKPSAEDALGTIKDLLPLRKVVHRELRTEEVASAIRSASSQSSPGLD